MASTTKPRPGLIGKGKSKAGREKAPNKTQGGDESDDDRDDNDDHDHEERGHGHVSWFVHGKKAMKKQVGAWDTDVLAKVDKVGTQPNKTRRKEYMKNVGWREAETLVR